MRPSRVQRSAAAASALGIAPRCRYGNRRVLLPLLRCHLPDHQRAVFDLLLDQVELLLTLLLGTLAGRLHQINAPSGDGPTNTRIDTSTGSRRMGPVARALGGARATVPTLAQPGPRASAAPAP